MSERAMPHNIEAEQSVLGSMFLSKLALNRACESLEMESFYLESHATIFDVIRKLSHEKSPIDITTVTARLDSEKKLSQVGGVEYVTELVDSVPSAANAEYYIKIIEEESVLRKLIEEATEIATNSYNRVDTVAEILDNAEKKIFNVVKTRKTSEFKKIQDVLTVAHNNIEILSQTDGAITGLATGFADLDLLTTGLKGSQFIIVAARPAMGKTAFGLNIVANIAQESEKAVAIFNLEMSAEQLVMRMISSAGCIDGRNLSTGNLTDDDWKKLGEAIKQLAETNIYIDDTPGITVGEIRAKCRRLASSEQGLSLVVIDYLQLISGSAQYRGNRQQEVSEISRSLKTLALELNIPIIALAQLSRNVEMRDEKRPIMSDLRESGSLEQDADIVAFLYRDDYYNKLSKVSEDFSNSELILGKHRNGPTDTVNLIFKNKFSTFVDKIESRGEYE